MIDVGEIKGIARRIIHDVKSTFNRLKFSCPCNRLESHVLDKWELGRLEIPNYITIVVYVESNGSDVL